MWPSVVIILKVRNQYTVKMGFAQHNLVIQTLSANGAYDSLDVRVLPGKPRYSRNFLNAHCVNSISRIPPLNCTAVSDKKLRGLVQQEGIDDLLCCPLGAGNCRHVEMNK